MGEINSDLNIKFEELKNNKEKYNEHIENENNINEKLNY